jgi:CBS domain-containing protein
VALAADDTVAAVRAWFGSHAAGTGHQGFPVLDREQLLVGVITRRDIFDAANPETSPLREIIKRPPAIVFEDNSLREAADHIVKENVGRLPVVARDNPRKVTGWLTRSDILSAHRERLVNASLSNREINIRTIRLNRAAESRS